MATIPISESFVTVLIAEIPQSVLGKQLLRSAIVLAI